MRLLRLVEWLHPTTLLAIWLAATLVVSVPGWADDPPPAARDRLSIQLQPADDPVTRLDPVRPRTPEEQRKLDAIAHFMAGELYLERGGEEEITKALRELEKSIELNPQAIEPYRLYLPAVVGIRDDDRAAKYALLATRNTTEGVQLLRALVAIYVQQGRLAPAIALLQQALEGESLARKSFARLILQRHLGQIQALNDQAELAAESYRTLLEDLRPEPPPLTNDERKQLLGERGELYEDMGNVFLSAKLPELAVEAFAASAAFRKGSPGVHSYNLALVFQQTGNPERALTELEKYFAAQLVEKGRAPYQLLKDLLAELNREEELLDRLQKLAASDVHNKALHQFLASELVATGKLEEAEKIYKERGGQTDPEAMVGLASVYRRQGRFDEWLTIAGRAFVVLQLGNDRVRERLSPEYRELGDRFETEYKDLAADSDQLSAVLELGRQLSGGDNPKLEFEQAWLLGRMAAAGNRSEDASRFYRYAIGMQNLPAHDLFRELGAYFIEAKEYKQAERVFQDAADHPALDPYRSYSLYLMAIAQELDGRIEPAVATILEARKITPDQSAFALQHARIYYRARRWDDAINVFEGIIRDFKDDADLVRDCRFSLSAIHVQKGDFETGEQILLDILEQSPDHPQANNDLGYLWADRNVNLERARKMIEKALAAEPDNAAYEDSMGWVLYRLGEYEQAVKHLESAASKPRGEDPTILDHLGDCFVKMGKTDKAAEAYRKALELEEEKSAPDQELVEKIRKKLAEISPASEPTVD